MPPFLQRRFDNIARNEAEYEKLFGKKILFQKLNLQNRGDMTLMSQMTTFMIPKMIVVLVEIHSAQHTVERIKMHQI